MWAQLHGGGVREDSAEADLFKLVVQDLSVGHVIRQQRPKDPSGRFFKQRTRKTKTTAYIKSAFDAEKGYEVTAMGRQFVHYTMNELVPKIGAPGTDI